MYKLELENNKFHNQIKELELMELKSKIMMKFQEKINEIMKIRVNKTPKQGTLENKKNTRINRRKIQYIMGHGGPEKGKYD